VGLEFRDERPGRNIRFRFALYPRRYVQQFQPIRYAATRPSGLVGRDPAHAVTFVENHDTDLNFPARFNKILGYAYILTSEGYPMVYCYSRAGQDPTSAVPHLATTQVFEGAPDLDTGPAIGEETTIVGRIGATRMLLCVSLRSPPRRGLCLNSWTHRAKH